LSSEDGAAGAACWSEIVLNLVFEKGTPGEDAGEDVLTLAVVGHGHGVAFLATARINLTDREAGRLVDLISAHDSLGVDAASWQGRASGRGREPNGSGSSSVGHNAVDLTGVVGVRLLVQGNADELMRSNIGVEPVEDLVGQCVPVSIATADVGRESVDASRLASVPGGLAACVANVLWRAADRQDVNLASLN